MMSTHVLGVEVRKLRNSQSCLKQEQAQLERKPKRAWKIDDTVTTLLILSYTSHSPLDTQHNKELVDNFGYVVCTI